VMIQAGMYVVMSFVLVSNMWISRIFNWTIWQVGNHMSSHTVHYMHACSASRAL
jgi:hypothetical protein